MKTIFTAIPMALLFLVAGCRTTSVTPLSAGPEKKMDRSAKVYIVTPPDGNYGAREYKGSGNDVATAFSGVFARYSDEVIIGGPAESASAAVEGAKLKKCQYVIYPKITHWEDRATEWSGKRDKLRLVVKVLAVEDGKEIKTAEITGKSSYFTFGGDHPQDLLRSPIQAFVDTLF